MTSLQSILQLSITHCKKNHVTLTADKTKLQVFSSSSTATLAYYATVVSPVKVEDDLLEFVEEAELVGIVMSINDKLPHILNLFAANKKSLAAVLLAGLTRSHHGNPSSKGCILLQYSYVESFLLF